MIMRKYVAVAIGILLSSGNGFAQNEAALRSALMWRTVTPKVSMPATFKGVDVYPAEPVDVEMRSTRERLQKYGTAVHAGTFAIITNIVVKRGHIEIQLDGGGAGRFAGDSPRALPGKPSTVAPMSGSESRLRDAVVVESYNTQLRDTLAVQPVSRSSLELQRQQIQQLEQLRRKQDAASRDTAMMLVPNRTWSGNAARISKGSRFNLRFNGEVPDSVKTPAGLMRVLEPYVHFANAERTR